MLSLSNMITCVLSERPSFRNSILKENHLIFRLQVSTKKKKNYIMGKYACRSKAEMDLMLRLPTELGDNTFSDTGSSYTPLTGLRQRDTRLPASEIYAYLIKPIGRENIAERGIVSSLPRRIIWLRKGSVRILYGDSLRARFSFWLLCSKSLE